MAKAKLPPTVKTKLVILAQLHSPGDGEPGLICMTSSFSEDSKKIWARSGYFFVKEMEVETDLPQDFDVVGAQLACMRAAINEKRAEAQNEIARMVSEMQKFEALAWNGSEE